MSRRYPPSARSTHFRQLPRSLRHQVYPPLQFLLQVGNVHLVRDAISVADALHKALLNQFFQTPHYGYARQLQRVRDLACANGGTHDRAQEDVNADGYRCAPRPATASPVAPERNDVQLGNPPATTE